MRGCSVSCGSFRVRHVFLPAAIPPTCLRPTIPDPRTAPTAGELLIQREHTRAWPERPLISILTPVYRVPLALLQAAVASVLAQSYDHWELCLTIDAGEPLVVREFLERHPDPRLQVRVLPQNLGIAGNTNECLALAQGQYIALLDHDDELAPHALYAMVDRLRQRPAVDVLYSDKDSFGINHVCKSGWSPELLWSSSYLTHLTLFRTALVREAGGFRPEVDGAQDWDFCCRVITRSVTVQHVPEVLYHWRVHAGSTSTGAAQKPYVDAAQLRTVGDHLERLGLAADSVRDDRGELRIRWRQPERQSVSILLIGGDEQQAARLRERTRYAAFEVVAVPDWRDLDQSVRQTSGQCLLFLDRQVRPLHESWLQDLIPPLQHGPIGAVAPLLLDPYTHLIRHAGFAFIRSGGLITPFVDEPVGRFGPLGRNDWYRNWSALSGACLAMRRESFDAVQGFTPAAWHPWPDVDLCLRLQYVAGLRLLLQASAQMEQSGSPWSHRRTFATPVLFPEGDPHYALALDTSHSPAFTSPTGKHAVAPLTLGEARDITWVLTDLRDLDRRAELLSYAAQLLREQNIQSHFYVQDPVPIPIHRARLATRHPRLAADCRFGAAARGVVVALDPACLPFASSIENATKRYAIRPSEPDVLEPFSAHFSWIVGVREVHR